MRNLIEFILLHIVQNPDAVAVAEEENEGRFVYTISVHPDDVGRVIGRNGRTIDAIRSLAKVRAMKDGLAVQVKVASEPLEERSVEAPAEERAPELVEEPAESEPVESFAEPQAE